jgi:FAD/FMN-containing dehydrogenase
MGSAVTVGSGVALHTLYQATERQGKIFVGGSAASVVPAGGYVQGAGHSSLSPTLGLAADNVLGTISLIMFSDPLIICYAEFQIVIADGSLVTANEVTNPDRTTDSDMFSCHAS